MSEIDYLIHGAGGVGCVVAARLTSAGRRVGLVARGPHLEALQTRGLRVVGDTDAELDLPAVGDPGDLELAPDGIVVLAMKTNDTEAALDAHLEQYGGHPIVCFQNGVANEGMVAQRGLTPYGCRVFLAGRILEPGVVAHTGGRPNLTIGCWPTGIDEVCERIASDLEASGIDGRASTDVQALKWGKLLANVNNAFLALVDLSTQESRRHEEYRHFLADVQAEALAAVEAAGIDVDGSSSKTSRDRLARLREPGEWTHIEVPTDPDQLVRPSTWQDLHFQRGQVEVDWFNGEIVRLGEEFGVPTPLNRVLRDLCVAAAEARTRPGTETTASLRAVAAALET